MTTTEFSNELDIILNSYNSSYGIDIHLDEYEKSVYLTKAQEELVIDLYKGGIAADSFEETEQIRRYLSNLIKTEYGTPTEGYNAISENSVFYNIPSDVWFITLESAQLNDTSLGCLNGSLIEIDPVTQDKYHRIKNNPFKGPTTRRALRLDIKNNTVEIISKYKLKNYLIRYISRPSPIILVDLPENLSINNCNTISECVLSTALHRNILERAAKLAIASKAVTSNNK